MTTPSSLEELREELYSYFVNHKHKELSNLFRDMQIDHAHTITDDLESIFRSHMEAVIEHVLGDDWYCDKYECDSASYDTCKYCGEPLYKHKGLLQRQRAKSYLEGEK